jgi:hypothetical protein
VTCSEYLDAHEAGHIKKLRMDLANAFYAGVEQGQLRRGFDRAYLDAVKSDNEVLRRALELSQEANHVCIDAEIKIRAAVRKHRDARGHDRCWLNDLELYRALGEPVPDDPGLPSHGEFMMRCEEYFAGQCRLRREGEGRLGISNPKAHYTCPHCQRTVRHADDKGCGIRACTPCAQKRGEL